MLIDHAGVTRYLEEWFVSIKLPYPNAPLLKASTSSPNTIPSGFQPVSLDPAHVYNVGDKVKVDFSQDEYEVMEQTGVNLWQIPEYMLKETTSGNIVYNMESEMHPIPKGAPSSTYELKSKCECGAVKVYGKEASTFHHSTWCPEGEK